MLVKVIKVENELNLYVSRGLLGKIIRVEKWNTKFYWSDDYNIFIPIECCEVIDERKCM